MKWFDLKTNPPSLKEHCVLLFPVFIDCGYPYTVSNPYFARTNAVKQGYTHWARITKPAEYAAYEKKMIDDLLSY